MLVNTIYLKAPWKYPFEHTEKASFKLTNGQNTEVDMMVMEDDFASGDVEELNAKIVVLPYKVCLWTFVKFKFSRANVILTTAFESTGREFQHACPDTGTRSNT